MSMNKILIIGNLGRDPEMRYTPSGQAVTNFTVATNRRFTTADGERREQTEWFRISAWGRLAETCNQFLTKGRQVYVEGRLRSQTYETADGQTRFSNEISATDVRFLGQPAAGESESPHGEPQPAGEDAGAMEADDLPF